MEAMAQPPKHTGHEKQLIGLLSSEVTVYLTPSHYPHRLYFRYPGRRLQHNVALVVDGECCAIGTAAGRVPGLP